MQEVLTDKFYSFIKALEEGDANKIRAMSEKRFGQEVVANLDMIKKNEIKFVKEDKAQIKSDSTDYGDLRANLTSDNNDTYIVDSLIVKGVSVIRSENDCNYDYNLQKNLDSKGMRFYMHKYFTGHMHYYLHLKY